MVALAAGALVAFVGLIFPPLRGVYDYAWFAGFGVSFLVYFLLANGGRTSADHGSME